jgi:hypothetical protein
VDPIDKQGDCVLAGRPYGAVQQLPVLDFSARWEGFAPVHDLETQLAGLRGLAQRAVVLDHLIQEGLERGFDPLQLGVIVRDNSVCKALDDAGAKRSRRLCPRPPKRRYVRNKC